MAPAVPLGLAVSLVCSDPMSGQQLPPGHALETAGLRLEVILASFSCDCQLGYPRFCL